MSEKLQKVLARAGLGSRRELETWIAEGRVQVNGNAAKLGDRVTEQDRIKVDGKPLVLTSVDEATTRVLMYNKPVGEVCSRRDEKGRPTVYDHLPEIKNGKWISIGRLDFNTSGLLLFTNNGELAHQLMHPSYHLEREYAVRVLGELTSEMAVKLTTKIQLEDGPARFEHIMESGGRGANTWYHLVIMEGRNRIVRRMFAAVGITINRLMRVRLGRIILPRELKAGQWRELDQQTVQALWPNKSQ